jgi:WD40 repeat protein
MLQIYTINGTFIRAIDTLEQLHSIRFSKDGECLITGGEKREIRIRDAFSLQIDHRLEDPDAAIHTLTITENEQHLLVGLANGKILVYALDSSLLRQRMLVKLNVLGF